MGPSLAFKIKTKWNRWKGTHFFRYGLPFLTFMVGTSFALTEITSTRYEVTAFRKRAASHGLKEEDERFDVEDVLKEVQAERQDDYENIRGPRDYEDTSDAMELLQKKIEETKKRNQGLIVQTIDFLSQK